MFFSTGGNGTATLSVSDGKGGKATDNRSFVVGTAGGNWSGVLINVPFTASLAQPTSGVVTGTWNLPTTPFSGILDPAALNRIDANGTVTLRMKVTTGGGRGGFDDFTFTGTMESNGTRIVGAVSGSGFANDPLTLTK